MPTFGSLRWDYDPPLPADVQSELDEARASDLFMRAAQAYAAQGADAVEPEAEGRGDRSFDPNEFARKSREENRRLARARGLQ